MNALSRLATDQPTTWRIRVRGIVQGVGFRPAVWRLARTLGLSGEVLNDGDGVAIRLHGLAAEIDDFMTRLRRDPPPLARIDTLETLRQRKRRPRKPLALMARDLEVIARYRTLSTTEQRALEDRAAPIVLLEHPGPEQLPEAVAPGSGALGFMLPHSPLHHLLARHFDTPLVFTSGNASGRPQCTDNDEALARLGAIADAFLLHDRAIVNRVDDSVLRLIDGTPAPLRRARGFAPTPLPLPPGLEDAPPLLALGGELKNTFCLLREGQATLSQHIGDLEQADTWRDWQDQLERFARLFAHRPQAIAIDGHPGYRSSAWGRDRATREGLPLITVQHHHAHLAACLAEHGVPADAGPSLGIVLDGIGHGEDGSGWGGELLVGDYRDFRRIARLRPAALPGGAQAMREPWRNLAARLLAEQLCERLRAADLQVLIHRQVPANDGGLALGQACIAAARLREQRR
ncbi:Sua5/YciO/YrdC/YwlC family protein [endosymbiont of unidentified scaly snail isolate Monju]|uniref:Sua5/YciO/YrdC/YwlC family protein n=1 Tax=endosymbiont of unidentified scaly snail isolate Monju TaxID=1248727 RepID=UPI0003892770|nr:Sua5/YciO/YrdC/YwlC family protein [endosymbiont of unidentified scaly snail isolate Monju]BAN70056.1 hydrogenase maturation protein HypF [endosymbiont of unidentified scaly snail isolate Monju]